MGGNRPSVIGMAVIALICACQIAGDPVTREPPTGPASPMPEEPQDPPSWITLEIRYSARHSLGRRRLDVLTTNNRDSQIVVTSIALRADHFEPLAPEVKNSTIRPGATVAVKTDFGPLEGCESSRELGATVAMEISVDGADPISLRARVNPEPLDRIRDVECDELAVQRAVSATFADEWTSFGTTIRTEVVFTHLAGDERVVVEAVGGMILFGMHPYPQREPPLAILEPGADPVALPVDLTLIRCDVHAVSQAPDGYAFRVWIAVGERDPFAITILASTALQAQLEELVDQCLGA